MGSDYQDHHPTPQGSHSLWTKSVPEQQQPQTSGKSHPGLRRWFDAVKNGNQTNRPHPPLHSSMGMVLSEIIRKRWPESTSVLTSSPNMGVWANPDLALGQRRVKSSPWRFRLQEDTWGGKMGTSETTPAICKANRVDFPLICSQLRAELGSNHSCSLARACSSRVLTLLPVGAREAKNPLVKQARKIHGKEHSLAFAETSRSVQISRTCTRTASYPTAHGPSTRSALKIIFLCKKNLPPR